MVAALNMLLFHCTKVMVAIFSLNIGDNRRRYFFRSGNTLIIPGILCVMNVFAQQPNVLVIQLDDARYDMFQPNGGPAFFNTPSINRIANEGVNFKFTGATTAVCVPSRASFYTGLYSHHHGAFDNGTSPKPGLDYISSILQDAGYYTGFIGKWLLNDKLPDLPIGFDYWAITDDDDTHLDLPIRFNDSTVVNSEGHDAVVYTNLALSFLDTKVPSGQPWLLFVNHRVPHLPFEPISTEDSLYQFVSIPFPENFDPYSKDFPSYLYPGHEFEGDSAEMDQYIRDYFETCHAAEYSVERLIWYLDTNNLLNNTMVIFTSDNGYFLGEHYFERKSLAYDEGLRLPLFIRYPAWFAPGTVIENEFAANIDLAPTILEAAGIPDTFNMDGISLRKLASGQLHRKDFFLENYTDNGNNWEAVRSFNYLYIYSYCSTVTEEFFDLTIDPQQNKNLINDANYAALIQEYRLKRDSIRLATNDTIYPALQPCFIESEYYLDEDNDGYGNPQLFIRAATAPSGYVDNNEDCNDDVAANGAQTYPGAGELLNGLDDDCDGLIDESSTWYADADQDGFGNALDTSLAVEMPTGYVADQTDCNDDTLSGGAAIFPGAPEIFNGIDDDCNGMIDEELVYEDADQDGFGNPAVFAEASDSLPGYVADDSDCNDDPLNGGSAINPAATDLCNLIDDNCNGVTDENATVASISPEGIVSVCTSTDVVFTANTGSGITYQWLKDGAAISGATNNTYTTTKKGDYQVIETNTFNCIATSQPTTLKTLTRPSATITPLGDLDICLAGNVKLQANGGAGLTYQWKKGFSIIIGATKKNYTANKPGTYKVVVTKSNGCDKTSDGVEVTESCKIFSGESTPDAGVLSCYPNPADGNFTIHLSRDALKAPSIETALVEVVNAIGIIVYSETIVLDDGRLVASVKLEKETMNGIYLVKVSLDAYTYYNRIVVQR